MTEAGRDISNKENQKASINFRWLLHLRWGAILCQIVLIGLVSSLFHIDIPFVLVCAIILFEIISNCAFVVLKKRQTVFPEWLFAAIMFLDVLFLTVLLAKTGGAMNPFTFLYLLHVVIGAMTMRQRLAWALGGYTIACYTSFFFAAGSMSTPGLTGAMEGAVASGPVCLDVSTLKSLTSSQMDLHLQGMLVAFAITALSLIFFISRLRQALDGYSETIELLKNEQIKSEKLGALATLAAGAAHEFSTPLSTIAVAAGEMLYACKEKALAHDIVEDALLIKNQVAVCKDILEQLGADAGSYRGEVQSTFTLEELQDEVLFRLPQVSRQTVQWISTADIEICLPFKTFAKIIKGLVKNSLDATEKVSAPKVTVSCEVTDQNLLISFQDNGCGMDKASVEKIYEPFFTTKEAGKGMGLGLFLAKSFVDRMNGKIHVSSELSQGTTITLHIPLPPQPTLE